MTSGKEQRCNRNIETYGIQRRQLGSLCTPNAPSGPLPHRRARTCRSKIELGHYCLAPIAIVHAISQASTVSTAIQHTTVSIIASRASRPAQKSGAVHLQSAKEMGDVQFATKTFVSVVGVVSARVAGPKQRVFSLFIPAARHNHVIPKIAAGKIAAGMCICIYIIYIYII